MTFETYVREDVVEGVGPWVWPVNETGAWLGPSQEFAAIRTEIMRYVKNPGTIVQAGGCCGMYPKLFSKIFEKVYTFEPAPMNWHCLVQNCPEPNIIKYNVALGEHNQDVMMELSDVSNVGMNAIREKAHSADASRHIMVPQIALDSLNIDCDAIQWDLEGYEPVALLGAAQTIARCRPVICLETRNPNDESHMLLQSWGYKVGPVVRYDTIFIPY